MPTIAVLRVRAHSFSPQNVKADVASKCLASGMPTERPLTGLNLDMKCFRDRLIAGWTSGNGGSRVVSDAADREPLLLQLFQVDPVSVQKVAVHCRVLEHGILQRSVRDVPENVLQAVVAKVGGEGEL